MAANNHAVFHYSTSTLSWSVAIVPQAQWLVNMHIYH